MGALQDMGPQEGGYVQGGGYSPPDKRYNRIWSRSRQYASYWNAFLLSPANEVWGKVIFQKRVSRILFTGVGGIPACIAGGIPACLAGLWGGVCTPACPASFQAHTKGGA